MKRSTRILTLSVPANNAGVSRHRQTAVAQKLVVLVLARFLTDFHTSNIAEQHMDSSFTL